MSNAFGRSSARGRAQKQGDTRLFGAYPRVVVSRRSQLL